MVRPGQTLRVEVTLRGHDETGWDFNGVGSVDGQVAVQGRFRLVPLAAHAGRRDFNGDGVMTLTQEQVFEKVRAILVEALGVDEDEVTPQATLVGDLGAESIDFLDIVFRLEKAGVRDQDRTERTSSPTTVLTDPTYVVDGKVTDQGMAELRQRLPHANLDGFDKTHEKSSTFPSNVFTVDDDHEVRASRS